MNALQEYFLLTQALETAKATPEPTRVVVERQLLLAQQKAEAADALWSNGHGAEGLRLAVDALHATVDAVSLTRAARTETPATAPDAKIDDAQLLDGGTPDVADAKASDDASPDEKDAAAKASDHPDAGEDEKASDAEETAAKASDDVDAKPDREAVKAPAADESEAAKASDDEADDAHVSEQPAAEAKETEPAAEPVKADAPKVAAPEWIGKVRAPLGPRRVEALSAVLEELRTAELPELDGGVLPAHGDLFQRVLDSQRRLHAVLRPASQTPGHVARLRAFRLTVTAVGLLSGLIGAYYFLRTPEGLTATASDHYDERFPGTNAVDGDMATEWLLPNQTQGTLDLSISPSRTVHKVRILNGHNPPHNDRAVRAYVIEVYSNGNVAETINGEFPFAPTPAWVEHPVNVDDVDQVRVSIRSWYRDGAALAEVEVTE